jgi:hypothetical protein
MTFLQGNMFQGDSLPTPHDALARTLHPTATTSSNTTPAIITNTNTAIGTGSSGVIATVGAGKGVVYLLHSILHNWGTQDALNILRWVVFCAQY